MATDSIERNFTNDFVVDTLVKIKRSGWNSEDQKMNTGSSNSS